MGDPTAVDDFELLEAWSRGDASAGDRLFRRHALSVLRFFRSKVPDVAEDLTQRTLLACVEATERFRKAASFRAYLFGIARNQLLMHLRRASALKDRFELMTHSVVDTGNGAPVLVARREEQRIVLDALRRIPVDFQIALELFYWEEMPIAEIAQVLGVAPGTVKSRLSRAREMMRDQLAALTDSRQLLESTAGELDKWARSLGKIITPGDDERGI